MTTPAPARPIRLYRFALSGHAHRAQLGLALLGLPVELIDVDLRAGAHKRPEFLRLNPFGQVPVIDDDGVVVPDSNAILTYLAERYDTGGRWLPRDPVGRARVQAWFSAAAGPLAFGAALARAAVLFKNGNDPAPGVARAQGLLKVMDGVLAAQPFLAADHPTLADIALYSYTVAAPEGGIALDPYPAVQAWLARVEALPGFVPMPVSPVGLRAPSAA